MKLSSITWEILTGRRGPVNIKNKILFDDKSASPNIPENSLSRAEVRSGSQRKVQSFLRKLLQRTHKEAAGQVETLTSSSERKGLRVGRELKTQGERIIRQRLMAEAWEREITRVVDLIGKSFKEGMDGRKATREELQRDLRPDMVSLKDKLKKLAGITRDLALQMVFPTEMREDGLSPMISRLRCFVKRTSSHFSYWAKCRL
ncbi:MAG: hypothetical protein HYU34_02630 [Candidatus Omnitrophica bacterium]|nr:hypothetical protein [Candidatus Omnitrophota bacterium]